MSAVGLVAAVLCTALFAAVVVLSAIGYAATRGHSMEGDR